MAKQYLHLIQDDPVTGEVRVVASVNLDAVGDGTWTRDCLRDLCAAEPPVTFWKTNETIDELLARFKRKRRAA